MEINEPPHLRDSKKRGEFFIAHKEEVINSGYRFAVIYVDVIKERGLQLNYYNNLKELYQDHPLLDPKTPRSYGNVTTSLVDIGQLTKSQEYQKGVIRERKTLLEKTLSATVNELHDLEQKEMQFREKPKDK